MFAEIEASFRRVLRRLSRSELAIRWMNLPVYENCGEEAGLLLIQIDGLGRQEMERAVSDGRMPFLKSLFDQGRHECRTFYPGLPSTTPAVQGELFYDVRAAVPAFSFRDQTTRETGTMFDPERVRRIESELEKHATGLLSGGSSWSNIYCGGASLDESHFCVASMGEGRRPWQPRRLVRLIGLGILHLRAVLRICGLVVLEFALGVADAISGIFHGKSALLEGGLLLSRMCVGIGLREVVTIGVKTDLARGLPIVHVNFLGYDESAHRRGPDSWFAHWTLRGIDRAVQKLHRAAHRSMRRDYQVWIFSDHGQERTRSFAVEVDGGIRALVEQCLDGAAFELAAMGPVGHLYFEHDDVVEVARRLVANGVPAVIVRQDEELLWCDRRGSRPLSGISSSHTQRGGLPMEMVEDLAQLARHPASGQLILLGWSGIDASAWTFNRERGSHGGFGPKETEAFVLTPAHERGWKESVRPSDLRRAALDVLRRSQPSAPVIAAEMGCSFRLMTYNVHSCIGTDGRVSPRRIAKLIAEQDPDIVAVQEVEHGRKRSRDEDQATMIAKALGFHLVFCPTVIRSGERYGHAVLSRFPLRTVKIGSLPTAASGWWPEPRCAIWTRVQGLNVVTTHLGLNTNERLAQANALLGGEWLDSVIEHEPTLVCGDFNFSTQSRAYALMTTRLRDAAAGRRLRTFPSAGPFVRIDHVFLSTHVNVKSIETVQTELSRTASDHLPVVADLEILPR